MRRLINYITLLELLFQGYREDNDLPKLILYPKLINIICFEVSTLLKIILNIFASLKNKNIKGIILIFIQLSWQTAKIFNYFIHIKIQEIYDHKYCFATDQ